MVKEQVVYVQARARVQVRASVHVSSLSFWTSISSGVVVRVRVPTLQHPDLVRRSVRLSLCLPSSPWVSSSSSLEEDHLEGPR